MQLSNLTDENQCKSCANCCKFLTLWTRDAGQMSKRLDYLTTNDVSYIRTGYFTEDTEWLILKIDSPCTYLTGVDGDYQCSIWDSPEKPDLCRSYPSNQFYDFVTEAPIDDEEYINKTINAIGQICPAIKGKTLLDIKADQIIQKNRLV